MTQRYRGLKGFVYRMKQRYGEQLTIVHFVGTTTDLSTGQIVKNTVDHLIQKAIIFPKDFTIKSEYDLAFIAVNKNFTYGGQFVTGTQMVMLDRADLDPAFTLGVSDEVVLDSKRFVIESIVDYREERILVFSMKRLEAL